MTDEARTMSDVLRIVVCNSKSANVYQHHKRGGGGGAFSTVNFKITVTTMKAKACNTYIEPQATTAVGVAFLCHR